MVKPEKTVRVRIRARQMVSYDQTVTLSVKEWAELKATDPAELCESGDLCGRLDLSDIDDGSEIEDDFEMEVVDENGKSVNPPDRYEQE